jgi:WD40-like Beta Propeller Repeat
MRTHLLLLTLACAACGSSRGHGNGDGGSDSDGSSGGTLVISPADLVLDVDGQSPATVTYSVTRGGQDVTSQAAFIVDDGRFGGCNGPIFTSAPGAAGKTTIRATVGQDSGWTSLTLRVKAVVIDPSAPADAPQKFGGPANGTLIPQPIYPPDGALVPPNLNELELHWTPNQADLFEFSFIAPGLDLKLYTACKPVGQGCAILPDETTWKLLSGGGRGQTVQVTMRGTKIAGGGVGSAPARSLSFADEDMLGGLYYWAASAGGLYRYDFGLRNQKAEPFYTPSQASAQCVGCHALSRDGKRIAVGMNVPAPAEMRALDVASRKKLFEVGSGMMFGGGSDYESFTADGARLVTTEGGGLSLRDGATGAAIGKSPAVANADMPDVSPDGQRVVFARGANMCNFGICMTLSVTTASLFTVPLNGNGFGNPTQIVAGGNGNNNYYPSFSPDGSFVVFNRAANDSYDQPDAKVMLVSSNGGEPIDLATVNATAGNSWPKWSPFVHHFQGATIWWITFSSRRAYGVRQPMEMGSPASQLWIVPVDPAKLAMGQDPGYPPLWLPFQDIATGNHIAQWVEKVERAPCSQVDQSGCMPGEECVNGVCVPPPG